MDYQIENEKLQVRVSTFGAEIHSVRDKKDGFEYMWQADPAYWKRTSPVLFPFVGAVKNKTYRVGETTYPMGQHGFARDMEFTLEEKKEDSLWFVLKDNEATLKKYPYHFILHIGYELKNDTVRVLWKVENPAAQDLYFAIGAHPAFHCPIHGEKDKTGYGVVFEGEKDALWYHGCNAEGLAVMDEKKLPLSNGYIAFDKAFFDTSALMFEKSNVRSVTIVDTEKKPYLKIAFQMPLFAMWSPEKKNAPFICIEPWLGRCDRTDFQGEIQERDYENCLHSGETFENGYEMTFMR